MRLWFSLPNTVNWAVPLGESAKVLQTKDPNVASQLNLITCGGRYDKATKLYDHRTIISAKLL